MGGDDRRGRLAAGVFSYRVSKDEKVFIAFHGTHVTTLAGQGAADFVRKVAGADPMQAQLLMARATGNFKHGNE